MNGAVLVALVASALVGVSTANPAQNCQDPRAAALGQLVPGIARKCGDCECADTDACRTDFAAVTCTLKEFGWWNFETMEPTPALIMQASMLTGIDVSQPITVESLAGEASRIIAEGCVCAAAAAAGAA